MCVCVCVYVHLANMVSYPPVDIVLSKIKKNIPGYNTVMILNYAINYTYQFTRNCFLKLKTCSYLDFMSANRRLYVAYLKTGFSYSHVYVLDSTYKCCPFSLSFSSFKY